MSKKSRITFSKMSRYHRRGDNFKLACFSTGEENKCVPFSLSDYLQLVDRIDATELSDGLRTLGFRITKTQGEIDQEYQTDIDAGGNGLSITIMKACSIKRVSN